MRPERRRLRPVGLVSDTGEGADRVTVVAEAAQGFEGFARQAQLLVRSGAQGGADLVKLQLEQAKQAFTIVATRFADHRKAPDAVYKLGVTHDRLGEKEQARRSMQTVIDDYPSSSAADLARKFLESQNG